MIGLIVNDLYLTVKNFKLYFIMVLIFVACSFVEAFSAVNSVISFYIIYAYLLIAMIPMSLYTLDEQSRWCAYSMTMPVSRREYVGGKYIISLMCTAFNVVVWFITRLVSVLSASPASAERAAMPLSVVFATSLLIPVLSLPFAFKFGSAKSRLISIFVVVIFAVGIANLSTSGLHISIDEGVVTALMYLVPLALFIASWALSVRIYNKKEL